MKPGQPHATDPAGQGPWRRAELLALVGTIPAFYLALLGELQWLAGLLYGMAGTLAVLAPWREARHARRAFDLLLAGALLASAAAPAGDAWPVLCVRLATAAMIVLRFAEALRPWFMRGGLPYLMVVAISVLGLSGLGFWWLEPQAHSLGDGLWLAFATAATVGYGDIVPSTPASKIFAVFVVLMGLAVLSLVTAAIAAMWVQSEERRIEREVLHDIHREMKRVHAELDALRVELARQRRTLNPPS